MVTNANTPGFAANIQTVDEITTLTEMTQDYTQTLANLAMATTKDRLAFNTLTQKNASINTQLILANNTETKLQAELETLKHASAKCICKGRCIGLKPYDPNGYFWSHGYKVRFGHNSATYMTKKEGHQTEATQSNFKRQKRFQQKLDSLIGG